MTGSDRSPLRRWGRSYRVYTIGCAVAWAAVWARVLTADSHETRTRVLYVFIGWLIGWVSASIARLVYPPPGSRTDPPPSQTGAGLGLGMHPAERR